MECKKCGMCCRRTIPSATEDDVKREPRIQAECKKYHLENEWCLSQESGCHFLGQDNLCTIYATRPDVCRSFQPGCPQCQEVRGKISFNKRMQLEAELGYE